MLAKMASYEIAIRQRVLYAFIITSLFTGLIFACIVSRPRLRNVWFHYQEYWVLPTKKLLLLAAGLFFLNLVTAYLIAHMKKWLYFRTFRLILAFIAIVALPLMVRLIEPLPLLLQFFLFRTLLVLLLTVALLVITQKWYWGITTLMLGTAVASPLLGALPQAVFGYVSPEWFEISQFLFGSVLLSALFGYWLVKATNQDASTGRPSSSAQQLHSTE